MRLAPCAPPPGLRHHALVDAPVTSIASPMLAEACAAAGEAYHEPRWCAYWDQSDEQGPYYLHDGERDAWYRVQLEGAFTPSFPVPAEPTRRGPLSLESSSPRARVRLVGRVPRAGLPYRSSRRS